MVELKRVYWSRQALRFAYTAAVVWLGGSVFLALMPSKPDTVVGQNASAITQILRGAFDRVLAAAAMPGLVIAVLVVIAVVIRVGDLRRPGPGEAVYPPAASQGHDPGRGPVRDGGRLPAPLFETGRARRPLLSMVERRIHQPAEFRRRLQPMQPCERRTDPVTCAAGKAGPTTALVRGVRR